MDLDDIRAMIRESISRSLKDYYAAKRKPAKDFSSFRMRLSSAVERCNDSRDLTLEARSLEDLDSDSYEKLYEVWKSISIESNDVDSWNDCMEHYIPVALSETVGYDISEKSVNRVVDFMKLSSKK